MGWARVNLPLAGGGLSGVCQMNFDTAHPSGSGRIENACGVTGGRSPSLWPGRRPVPQTSGTQSGSLVSLGADLAPICVLGLAAWEHIALLSRWALRARSWDYLGAVLGVLGLPWARVGPVWACLGLSWACLGLSWACLAPR